MKRLISFIRRAYLGSDDFRDWVYSQRLTDDDSVNVETSILFRPSIADVIDGVAGAFKVTPNSIVQATRGGSCYLLFSHRSFCQIIHRRISQKSSCFTA